MKLTINSVPAFYCLDTLGEYQKKDKQTIDTAAQTANYMALGYALIHFCSPLMINGFNMLQNTVFGYPYSVYVEMRTNA